ncbi:4'-phosphopantetheinyl transferase superfamily protein [Francisella noatunensis]|uniref:4'-phosphopantetheinyl transferase superfamily protein n=1 Tax=Francisella noatunensis TaxID=657445 RepID=A0A9Q2QED1_9GAMM|nr:4'-phosphopantetheinyl transferase superfamily protein [Francisella noatunensis]MBK2029470.1 4'-phosphopantetheinyl transferase superfamily protein [Francisella noatunensis]MBK2034148.1 4'-phosphopantetheinyl transferase superfamily protein [Francisella noatunensis]MBK2048878.1 4'-phosphopantetheinyl transferase superfamily protein [Francisella noatunensis]MBK2050749.1 4'-phosphopantetheinyl transferase superfamily protein [Francisella noatunensis]MBK2052228.1 4'-phosphopantetheinyl transfe
MLTKFNYHQKNIEGTDLFLLDVNDNKHLVDESIIPDNQLSDIQKYKIEFDRLKRLVSRSFLYTYLESKYQISNYEFAYNKYKKPYLKFHQNIDFSISYSKEYILIAISDKYKIGADIEYIDKSINYDELKDVIMHPEEISYYIQLKKDHDRNNFFFKVFNIKESIIKSLGMGLYFDVKKINTLLTSYKFFTDFFCNVDIDRNYKLAITKLDLINFKGSS